MKAQLGKPTGLALALLAALLATFLAMGVFSVAQANEHSAPGVFPLPLRWHLRDVVVTITLWCVTDNYGVVEETLPTGFNLDYVRSIVRRQRP